MLLPGWAKYLPSEVIWRSFDDSEMLSRMTSNRFAEEIAWVFAPISISARALLDYQDLFCLKHSARLMPTAFIPHVSEMLQNLPFCLPVFPLIFRFIENDQAEVLLRLFDSSPDTALLCLAPLAESLSIFFPHVKLHSTTIDLRRCSLFAQLKFFAKIGCPKLIPPQLFSTEICDRRELKWALRLSILLPADQMADRHIALLFDFPLESLESFLEAAAFREPRPVTLRALASMMATGRRAVRERAVHAVHEALKRPTTQIHFLALVGLALADIDDTVRDLAESAVRYHVRLREVAGSAVQADSALPAAMNLTVFFDAEISLTRFAALLPAVAVNEVAMQVMREANARSVFGRRLMELCKVVRRIAGLHLQSAPIRQLPIAFISDAGNPL
jgi:hypothetical protein